MKWWPSRFTNILPAILTDARALAYHLQLQIQTDITTEYIYNLPKIFLQEIHREGELYSANYVSRNINNIKITNQLQYVLFAINSALNIDNIKSEKLKDDKLSTTSKQNQKCKESRKTEIFKLNKDSFLNIKAVQSLIN